MKRVLILLCCVFFCLILTGCQNVSQQGSGVEVIIEGDGEFPEFLVGTWRANKDNWEFVFEPDGTISSVVISLGGTRIMPGQITTVPLARGGKGVFEAGEWLVNYVPAEQQLTVKISLEHFRMETGEQTIEGKETNIFVGKVDEDGKFWYVDWTGFPDYTAHTPKHRDFKLTKELDPEEGRFSTLVFEKVTNK